MSDTDLKWQSVKKHPELFSKIFARLAASKSQELDAVKIKIYHQTLGELPLIGVKQAAETLAKRPGGWLPAAGDWFELAVTLSDELWASRIQPQLPPASKPASEEDAELATLQAAKAKFLETVAHLRDFTGRRITTPETVATLGNALKTADTVPVYSCTRCRDRGWVRTNEHLGQQWTVTGCACRATNPVLNKHRRSA
jgi:hypothetical protein